MKKIVVKIGGSNLKTRDDIQKIIQVVKNYNRPLVIVVSAFFGVTDYLIKGIKMVQDSADHIITMQEFIRDLKASTIEANISDETRKVELYNKIDERLGDLERYLKGIHYIGDVPDFVEDVILSYGEKLSSLMLSGILNAEGIETEEKLPEDIGFYTDGEFQNGTVDFQLSEKSVSRALSAEKVFVVPGFYGISREGKVTLLGRGGSDYSAASFARCLGAESLDIWKDVHGYMSADPKLVDDPKRIKKLSYREAAELSYFGAKILHPRTVEPLMDRNIPVRIFNINEDNPDITPLSVIDSDTVISENVVKSVTYSDNFAVLKLSGPGVGIKPGVLGNISTILDTHGINIKSVVTSQTCINIYLDQADLKESVRVIKKSDLPTIQEITPLDNLSVVAIVGEGILSNHGLAFKMLQAINRKEINARIISAGASEVAAYIVVDAKNRDLAIRVIHDEFFA
ncbi:MAG: aspartate kinase [Spirochaetales bacterium]|nr:aspartate kinase [Spirochaetales bacterium]